MFTYHSPETAPKKSKPILENDEKAYGMIPNLSKVQAEAPATLESYKWLYQKFTTETSFTPLEQQIVMMTSNYENKCHYCVPAHTWIMKSAKMPEDIIEALREGAPLQDKKLEVLRVFTKELWDNRGHIGETKLISFLEQGYTKQQTLEVLTGMACKLLSNFTNALTNNDVDQAFKSFEWVHPSDR